MMTMLWPAQRDAKRVSRMHPVTEKPHPRLPSDDHSVLLRVGHFDGKRLTVYPHNVLYLTRSDTWMDGMSGEPVSTPITHWLPVKDWED